VNLEDALVQVEIWHVKGKAIALSISVIAQDPRGQGVHGSLDHLRARDLLELSLKASVQNGIHDMLIALLGNGKPL
jgi:hypothetical protein